MQVLDPLLNVKRRQVCAEDQSVANNLLHSDMNVFFDYLESKPEQMDLLVASVALRNVCRDKDQNPYVRMAALIMIVEIGNHLLGRDDKEKEKAKELAAIIFESKSAVCSSSNPDVSCPKEFRDYTNTIYLNLRSR